MARRQTQEGASERAAPSDLRVLARVLALQAIANAKPDEKLAFLLGAGFRQAEVAEMLGLNPISIRTAMHRRRKRKSRE